MNGIIFDIQRFSVYDGPGIRTNVFFKGCNLRCLWCHNPESQLLKPQLMLYKSKCTGCGECLKICKNTFTADCTACGRCVAVCRNDARKIAGEKVSADYVVETVLRDKEFYKTSGGGVTLTGGEPLLQPDFAEEILKKCKAQGINTAIETAANVDTAILERLLPYLDNVLCDIKCIDEEKHRALTGVSNKLILENAQMLKASGKNVVFRMPVIPTLNDDEVIKASDFAGDTPLEILAYHETGCSKYEALGKEYTLSHITPPTVEFMNELKEKSGAIYAPTGI